MTDVLVLGYHAVSEHWPAEFAVTPKRLASQLRHLAALGYRGTTLERAVTDPPYERTLAVTFDDGFRSVLECGLPVLAELGVPATVFVPTDFVASGRVCRWPGIEGWIGTAWEDELAPLSWAELDTVAAAGWEIGAHSCSHARLRQLTDVELERELQLSKEAIEEKLGSSCRSFSAPYGDVDQRVIAAIGRVGFVAACNSECVEPWSSLNFPRIGIARGDGSLVFRLKLSPATWRLRRHGWAWRTFASGRHLLVGRDASGRPRNPRRGRRS